MEFRVVYSPVAENDLDRIWGEVWTASQDFDVSDKYVADLRDAVRQKKNYPKAGMPLSYMGESTGLYYVAFKEYMMFYRIRGEAIEVVRVLFARSDYMKALFGKSEYALEDGDEE